MIEPRRAAASLTVILALVGCGGGDDDGHPAATATVTRTAIAATPTATARVTLPMSSPTASATATGTGTTPPTATPTPSATPSSTPRLPEITFFGIASADDLPLAPMQVDAAGRPVFTYPQAQGMTIVLEARRGVRALERSAYDPGGSPRGVEFLVSRPLGDGSPAVCDFILPTSGGVPGIDPPLFSDQPEVLHAIDDLGCRVNDGAGAPVARRAQNACTRMDVSFDYDFVDASSELQYCLPVSRAWNFPVGDTIVVARVRDVTGAVSATRAIVVRVEREPPFTCDQGLGERAFAVRRSASRLLTSATGPGDASADPWVAGTLHICAAQALGDGLYALTLRADAVFGLTLGEGGILCARVSARGSSGTLDCDGGSAVDVRAAQDENAATRVAVDSELGVDAGTGAAVMRAPIAVLQLPAGASPADCLTAAYPPSFNGALTTGRGTAQVVDAGGGVLAEASAAGASFRCDQWRDAGAGTFVLPFPVVNAGSGDRAAVLVLSE